MTKHEYRVGMWVAVRYGRDGQQIGRVLGHTPSGRVVVRKRLANSGRWVTARVLPREILCPVVAVGARVLAEFEADRAQQIAGIPEVGL